MNYDYIIIGSGAGGAAAAYRLARAGKQVLLLEKGGALPVDGSTLDFKKVINQGLFKSKEPWLDKNNERFVPEEFFNLGGKTKWYGAALIRFDRSEFDSEPAVKCLGWPIGYQDLETYYDEAEKLLGVRYFEIEPDLRLIRDNIERQHSGWRSSPLPLALNPAILSVDLEARHFDGFASARGLKADAQNALLNQILSYDNFTLKTGQTVKKLIGDGGDPRKITGVMLDNGRRYSGGRILLAAGAMHSPRLLQDYLEDSDLSGQMPCASTVGRFFKRHLLTAMLAFSPSKKTDTIRKTTVWLNAQFSHSSIQPLGFSEDVLSALLPGVVPRWLARQLGARAYGFFLQTEDGSDPDNRISTVSKSGARLPKLNYDPARFPELTSEHRRMIIDFRKTLRKAGCISFIQPIPLSGTAHACGTLFCGKDSTHSAVDPYGKVHGLTNLYVVDGSILPRSSRVNPALTIYAWALRTADHLLAGAS